MIRPLNSAIAPFPEWFARMNEVRQSRGEAPRSEEDARKIWNLGRYRPVDAADLPLGDKG